MEKKRTNRYILLIVIIIILILLLLKSCNFNTGKTLTVNLGTKDSPRELKLKKGETYNLEEPTKEGYKFTGWVVSSGDATISGNTLTMGSEESSISPKFEIINYKITYELDGGKIDSKLPTTYNIETPTFTIDNPTKDKYTFMGWSEDSSEELIETLTINKGTTGDKNYKAIYSVNNYKIIYNLDGGKLKGNYNTSYSHITKTFNLPVPSKKGYTFTGWYLNKNLTGDTVSKVEEGSTGDKEFFASWSLDTYTISYDLNGGIVKTDLVANYTVLTDNFALPRPTKDYYQFTGWTGSNGIIPNTNVVINKGSTGNKNYNANYKPLDYKITYNLDGGSLEGDYPTKYNIETDTFNLPIPSKLGYNFLGWYVGNDKVENIEKGSTGDKEYTAKWEIITYTITYNLNGGSTSNNPINTYTVEDVITLENPTKDYYVFIGWTGSNGESPTKDLVISKGSTGNKEYNANYSPEEYTITYNLNGGSLVGEYRTSYNIETETFSLPNAEREGYTLTGWFVSNETTSEMVSELTQGSTGNKEYYALWTPVTYNITYVLNEGSLSGNYRTNYNIETNTFNLPIPARDGYNFLGWFDNEGLTGNNINQVLKGSMGDKTFYAKWEVYETTTTNTDIYDTVGNNVAYDDEGSTFVNNDDGIDFTEPANIINGYGKYIVADTKNDEFPVYYYRGDIGDNNLIFAGFCWKILRTTSTGGTKIVYNGVAENNQCHKTGTDTMIGTKVRYNNPYARFEASEYMYNKSHALSGVALKNVANGVIFGNDVVYENGSYRLIDTYTKDADMVNHDNEILTNHHYTCNTTSDTCTSVRYIYMLRDGYTYFATLSGGEKVEDLVNNTAFNKDTATNSTIKTYIDNWYSNNLVAYTDYLEDTIFCNDHSYSSIGGWDKDTSPIEKINYSSTYRISEVGKTRLNCVNERDRYTVSTENGNGALTYPIGLVTADEAALSGYAWFQEESSSYLNNGHIWWTMSPSLVSANYAYVDVAYSILDNVHAGYISSSSIMSGGVRPSVSLKHGVNISSGTGSADDPYIVDTN